MKNPKWFFLSTAGLLLILFFLPLNSRADTLLEQYAGPFNARGNGGSWVALTGNPAPGFASSAVFGFSGARDVMPGDVETLAGSGMYAARPLFGTDGWGLTSSVWTGTSYLFPYCDSGGDSNPPVSTPEPTTLLLLATGVVGLLLYRRYSDIDV